MYHPSDPWGTYVALFSGLSWTRILVPVDANGVQLNLKIPKSFSQEDILVLILYLRIRFRVVILDTGVYPKVVMVNLDWHCTILQWNVSEFFWFIVQIRCASTCLVEPNENQCFYIEECEWGCWNLHFQVFESAVLSLWLLGCCIMFHMNWWLISFKISHWLC